MTRMLPAGAYLVEVREEQIDLRATIDAKEFHAELLDQVPRHGALHEVVRLTEPGTLSVDIRSADHPTKRGNAAVRISRWTQADSVTPSELEQGYVALGIAGRDTAVATPESWARAVGKLHEAVGHFERAGNDTARAQAAYSLAFLQFEVRDEWSSAARAAEIAIDSYRRASDETGLQQAIMLRAAADMEIAAGMAADTQRAELAALNASVDRRLTESAAYFTSKGMHLRAEYATSLRAGRAANIGDYVLAEKLLSEALALARSGNDVAAEARTLANLAAIHIYNGRIVQAAQEYEALEPMIDRVSQPYQYAAWLANYGFAMIALGNFDRALDLHLEALDLYTRTGEEDERAIELMALGGLYFRMGDPARALETLRAAIAAQRQQSDTISLASTLRVAGNAASALEDHEQALKFFRESARIDANPTGVAATRVLIAGELREQRKFRAAAEELAGPLLSENALVRANALEERARIAIATGDQDSVVEDLRAADRGYQDLGLEFNRIDTNTEISRVLLARGDVAGAATAADEAVAIVSRIRASSANPEWRARFLSARYAPFEARIAVELANADRGNDPAAWQAFRMAEQVRARSLADELALGLDAPGRAPDEVDVELRARLTSQQLRLESRVRRQDPDEEGTEALRRSITQTRAQIDSNDLRRGGVAARESSLGKSLAQVRKALPEDTAVLAYFVGDLASHAWVLTRRELRHVQLDSGASLVRSIAGGNDDGQFDIANHEATKRLGKLLFGGLLDGVTERRLLIVADGPLHSVPFAALPLPDDQLLVDRFVIGYAPSLALVIDKGSTARSRKSRVAVVSDPVYAPDDRRLRLSSAESPGKLRGAPQESPFRLTRLPYSAMEAGAVSKALAPAETIQLAGFEATADKVMQLKSNDLAILHFATHAIARSNSSEQSALFLTEYAPDGTLLPSSRLTPAEIRRSGLHAEVVVLSACATGDGNELRGEGVLGLTYGFLANGSRSVVASLWPIEDASTARFMSEFYKAYKSSGRAAEALRTAQMRFRAASASSVWSSFVVRANEFP